MRTILFALVAASIATSVGCGRTAVRASEKEFLADQVMIFGNDPHETETVDHVLTNREGAMGGNGATGGGCGCN